MTKDWTWLLFVALWAIVIAVADMNWPNHMGGSGHLLAALGLQETKGTTVLKVDPQFWDQLIAQTKTLQHKELKLKKYEIISKAKDGKLIAVATVEASDAQVARQKTANFCNMMNIEVHSVRVIK